MTVWHEVAEGCFRRRYERYDVNVGVVRGSEALLLFDTRGSPVQGAQLRDELKQLDRRAPGHVVNSHWHFDHWFGNQCIAGTSNDSVPRWAHPGFNEMVFRSREEMLRDALGYDHEVQPELEALELVLPDHFVHERVVLDLGSRTAELAYFGRGHTGHDVVVLVPDARVVFAGDLFEESAPPVYGDDSFPIAWAETVAALLAAAPGCAIVPGHGDVMNAIVAREQSEAISLVARIIRALHGAGEPAESAGAAADDHWPFPTDLLGHAVGRGYAELEKTAD